VVVHERPVPLHRAGDGYDYFAVPESPPTLYRAGTTTIDWQRGVFGPSLPDPRTGNPGSALDDGNQVDQTITRAYEVK
jgi:hypothetical protein